MDFDLAFECFFLSSLTILHYKVVVKRVSFRHRQATTELKENSGRRHPTSGHTHTHHSTPTSDQRVSIFRQCPLRAPSFLFGFYLSKYFQNPVYGVLLILQKTKTLANLQMSATQPVSAVTRGRYRSCNPF